MLLLFFCVADADREKGLVLGQKILSLFTKEEEKKIVQEDSFILSVRSVKADAAADIVFGWAFVSFYCNF